MSGRTDPGRRLAPLIGAGWPATLAVLIAGVGVLAIACTISLYAASTRAQAPCTSTSRTARTLGRRLTAGFFFVGALFLGGGGIYLGLGIFIDGFWT